MPLTSTPKSRYQKVINIVGCSSCKFHSDTWSNACFDCLIRFIERNLDLYVVDNPSRRNEKQESYYGVTYFG